MTNEATFEIRQLALDDHVIEYGVMGAGPAVVLLAGRGGCALEQFPALGRALAAAGLRAVAVNLRGVGASSGALANLTLHDLADDLAALIERLDAPVHVVGRAFGNRVARCLASDYPHFVRSLTLISAGGLIAPSRDTRATTKVRQRTPPMRYWREAGAAHQRAGVTTPVAHWWSGGAAPMFVIQGLDDRIAVPANGRQLAAAHPTRVQLLEVPEAGHFVLFERADIVIPAIVDYITAVTPKS